MLDRPSVIAGADVLHVLLIANARAFTPEQLAMIEAIKEDAYQYIDEHFKSIRNPKCGVRLVSNNPIP